MLFVAIRSLDLNWLFLSLYRFPDHLIRWLSFAVFSSMLRERIHVAWWTTTDHHSLWRDAWFAHLSSKEPFLWPTMCLPTYDFLWIQPSPLCYIVFLFSLFLLGITYILWLFEKNLEKKAWITYKWNLLIQTFLSIFHSGNMMIIDKCDLFSINVRHFN